MGTLLRDKSKKLFRVKYDAVVSLMSDFTEPKECVIEAQTEPEAFKLWSDLHIIHKDYTIEEIQ
jgi:hypothetical protein